MIYRQLYLRLSPWFPSLSDYIPHPWAIWRVQIFLTYHHSLCEIGILYWCCTHIVSGKGLYLRYERIALFSYWSTRLPRLTVVTDIPSSLAISRWLCPDSSIVSMRRRSAISSISAGVSISMSTHSRSLDSTRVSREVMRWSFSEWFIVYIELLSIEIELHDISMAWLISLEIETISFYGLSS